MLEIMKILIKHNPKALKLKKKKQKMKTNNVK